MTYWLLLLRHPLVSPPHVWFLLRFIFVFLPFSTHIPVEFIWLLLNWAAVTIFCCSFQFVSPFFLKTGSCLLRGWRNNFQKKWSWSKRWKSFFFFFEYFIFSEYSENSKYVRFNVPAVDLSSFEVALFCFC